MPLAEIALYIDLDQEAHEAISQALRLTSDEPASVFKAQVVSLYANVCYAARPSDGGRALGARCDPDRA